MGATREWRSYSRPTRAASQTKKISAEHMIREIIEGMDILP